MGPYGTDPVRRHSTISTLIPGIPSDRGMSGYGDDTLNKAGENRRRLAATIPIQDECIAQSQPKTITGPASSLPLVGVSLMTVVFLLGCFLRRRFHQVKPRDSFGFLP